MKAVHALIINNPSFAEIKFSIILSSVNLLSNIYTSFISQKKLLQTETFCCNVT